MMLPWFTGSLSQNPKRYAISCNITGPLLSTKKTAVLECVLIQFTQDKVSSIQSGGGMLEEITRWPNDTRDEISFHNDDSINNIYPKLLAIYQVPAYSNYQIILPDKSLEKPFDPDMANYNEWRCTFSIDVKPGRRRTSSVVLYFNKGMLEKIQHNYSEFDVYN
jgi:hypothetical protein